MTPHLLLTAKAPVAGLAKTRLGAIIGPDAAADLAAAALLDTIEACAISFASCHLALAGDLDRAERSDEIAAALAGWQVFEQQGDTFGARLAHAHTHVGGPVVQVGMDTPQLTPVLLAEVVAALGRHDAVLGPAADGGWWVLALRDPARAGVLVDVPMSRPSTYADTRTLLALGNEPVGTVGVLRDVDTVQDAELVAAGAPSTRFARAWRELTVVAS